MIHVLYNEQLLECRDPASWDGKPTVGQVYIHNNIAYDVDAIIVDTRKGYCELRVAPKGNKAYQIVGEIK